MFTMVKKRKADKNVSNLKIPREEWGGFLETFSLQHHGWLVRLETHDLVTGETVGSKEMPLQSIELDLEDEKNPRVNITVHFDNKIIKHVLFLPSQLVLKSSSDEHEESLQIHTVNTETTVHVRKPAAMSR